MCVWPPAYHIKIKKKQEKLIYINFSKSSSEQQAGALKSRMRLWSRGLPVNDCKVGAFPSAFCNAYFEVSHHKSPKFRKHFLHASWLLPWRVDAQNWRWKHLFRISSDFVKLLLHDWSAVSAVSVLLDFPVMHVNYSSS